MSRKRMAVLAAMAVIGAACARPKIPQAIVGAGARDIDQACNPDNAPLAGPVRMTPFGPAEFPVPENWIPNFKNLNELDFDLRRTGAELNVWKGGDFIFTPVLPINSVQCDIARGDTIINIRTTVLLDGIRRYRVDVSWSPTFEGQHLFMQLHTRFPEHLRQIRGVIDGVRFPVQTASTR